jgi:hypothetical protein
MSTAVISAFSRSEMPGAAEMSKAADKFMPGADKYFVFLDMSRSQLDNDPEAAAIGGNLRVPSDFFGKILISRSMPFSSTGLNSPLSSPRGSAARC